MREIDPETVPETPIYKITVNSTGAALVDGNPIATADSPEEARIAAIAEVRVKAALHGRPVRAIAVDQDGTESPLIVGTDGTVTTVDGPPPREPDDQPASITEAVTADSKQSAPTRSKADDNATDSDSRATAAEPPNQTSEAAGESKRRRIILPTAAILGVGVVAALIYGLPTGKTTSPTDKQAEAADAAEPQTHRPTPSQPAKTSPPAESPSPSMQLPDGMALRKDNAGFRVAVPEGWARSANSSAKQVRFTGDGLALLVVPGRDSTKKFGTDPMIYQREHEPELKAFRASQWATATGQRSVQVGTRLTVAEGTFGWKTDTEKSEIGCNRAFVIKGRYHVLLVTGPADRQDDIKTYCSQAMSSYTTAP